ncbi:MAG: major capsid protein [Fusobacteriaceae bacterium]
MESGLYTTRTIRKVREKIELKRNFLRELFFKNETRVDTSMIMLEITKGKESFAPFVAPLENGKAMENKKIQTNIITAPKIGVTKTISERDLELRGAGEPFSASKTESTVNVIKKILEDQENYIVNKEELMVSQFLTTGKVTSVDGDSGYEVDYGLGNIETLAEAEQWGEVGVNPIASLDKILTKAEENGNITDVIVMGYNAAENFIREAEKQKLLSRDLQSEFVKTVVRRHSGVVWIGTYKTYGIDLYRYKRGVLNSAGVRIELMPSNVIIGGPVDGEVLYAPVYNTNNVKEEIFKKVKRYSYVKNVNDSGLQIITQSRPVLQPLDVDGYFCVTVCK